MIPLPLRGAAILALATVAAPAHAATPVRRYTIEQFMTTTTLRDISFAADEGSILLSSNQTGVFNAYRVPTTGGPLAPLTGSSRHTTYAVSFFPADDRFLYTRDESGDEMNHLYVLDPQGRAKDLTPGKLKAAFQGFSGDGKAFYVTTNERDPRFFDLYRYDAATYTRTLVHQDDTGYQLGAISPDGRWLALRKPRTTSVSDLYLWDATTKETRRVSPEGAAGDFLPQDFDPQSRYLHYLTNEGSEFLRVRRYEMATNRHEEVEKADWDVLYSVHSKRGTYRVTGVNQDGRTVIRIVDVKTGKPVALPAIPQGDIAAVRISNSEKRVAFYVNGDRSPSNLYVWAFGDKEARRLTDSMNKEIDEAHLVESEVVRFRSFDKMEIPNLLWRPHGAAPTAKAPALVWVHGGPGGQTRKGYSALVQYLVNHGYVVLGINNRGSSGYGKTFYTADDGRHGREPLWDCVEAKKYLASLPYVDADRIGIIGGSYGGYMVLAALAFQPDVFQVGVDIFGVSNWVRTLKSMPSWWEAQRLALFQEMGDPEKDEAKLRAVSPVFHADKIRRPLIVLQGANDPRVIQPESDDIVAAVKKNGVPVEYLVFPDEGHGFTKRQNQVVGYQSILQFLDTHLKTPPAAGAAPAR
jgi:dipeptidyl aminopeptidase/acylaminoacyl peptidase